MIPAFLDALGAFADKSHHPEIATAPLLLWGMSAGGEFNYEFVAWKPERVVAFVVNKGGIYYTALAPKAARDVPGVLFVGGKDLESRTSTITGLFAGDSVVAIDRRPATREIYALGVSGAFARLYTINPVTGAATLVGGPGVALPQSVGVVGAETAFGFDFNPTVDRIRVVANNRDNFRLNPNTGGIAGTDTALNPGTPVVVAAAYTNNISGATTTTLYGIDTSTNPDQLVILGDPHGDSSRCR